MWNFLKDFFSSLPATLSFTLAVLIITAGTVIFLYGRFRAKIGNKTIDVGGSAADGTTSTATTPPKPPATTSGYSTKRSCGDCILIMMGEREKYELKMRYETERVLRTQMTFAEQKLIEIQTVLVSAYADEMYEHKKSRTDITDDVEGVQHKLFYGLLRDALLIVKDEIRRSFKDNGFFELSGSEFTFFVKDKCRTLISLVEQHLRNLYPSRGVILTIQDVSSIIERLSSQLESVTLEIFTFAKDTKQEAETKTKHIRTDFSAWIDNFIK